MRETPDKVRIMDNLEPGDRPSIGIPSHYRFVVDGLLDDEWSHHFVGLTLTRDELTGTTRLIGAIVDQAGLHAHLQKIRDLNLSLLCVCYCGASLP